MQLTLGKKVLGVVVSLALCFGMVPAIALSAPQQAEAATLQAGQIAPKVVADDGTAKLAKKATKKAKKTSLKTLLKNGELKEIINTDKWVKNKKYNAKEDSEWNKYEEKSLTEYNGKAKKPAVELYVENEKSTKKYTDKTANPTDWDRTFTGYTKLKGKVITGKETKKQLAKKTKGKDFTVQYENNKALGTAQIIIKGVNKYTGTIYRTFDIRLAEMKTVKAKAAKKGKVKGATSYVITASPSYDDDYNYNETTRSRATGVSKSVLVSNKKKSTTIKGLTKGTYYDVSVTAYANEDSSSYKYTDRQYVRWDEKTEKSIWKLYTNTSESYGGTTGTSNSIDKPVKVK